MPKSLLLAIYLVKVIPVHKSSKCIPLSVNLPKSLSLAIYLVKIIPVHKSPKCIPLSVNFFIHAVEANCVMPYSSYKYYVAKDVERGENWCKTLEPLQDPLIVKCTLDPSNPGVTYTSGDLVPD